MLKCLSKQIVIGGVFFISGACCLLAGEINAFKEGAQYFLYKGEERVAKFGLEKTPGKEAADDYAGVLSWGEGHHTSQEVYFKEKLVISDGETPLNGAISLKLYIDADRVDQVTALNVRLKDASNETLQWKTRVKLEPKKWLSVTVPVSAMTSKGSWGGDKNGKVDGITYLAGLSFYVGKRSVDGKLYIDNIEYTVK